MKTYPNDKLIVVGALKGAHGVRGEVRVKSFTADPEDLFSYGPLTDEAGRIVLTPLSARPGNDHFIVKAREQKQKEEWDALKGTLLHVARAQLPSADEGEFYIEDLVGLEVCSVGDVAEGRIKSVQNFGADDLLERGACPDSGPGPVGRSGRRKITGIPPDVVPHSGAMFHVTISN